MFEQHRMLTSLGTGHKDHNSRLCACLDEVLGAEGGDRLSRVAEGGYMDGGITENRMRLCVA